MPKNGANLGVYSEPTGSILSKAVSRKNSDKQVVRVGKGCLLRKPVVAICKLKGRAGRQSNQA